MGKVRSALSEEGRRNFPHLFSCPILHQTAAGNFHGFLFYFLKVFEGFGELFSKVVTRRVTCFLVEMPNFLLKIW